MKSPRSSSWKIAVASCSALLILFIPHLRFAHAQQPEQTTRPASAAPPTAPTPPATPIKDDAYVIQPGDMLDIRVLNYPQFSREAVRVERRGTILMPRIDSEIQAACHTTAELSQTVANAYLKYIRHPQVDVYVKESQAQPVAIIGYVNTPGRFQLQRRVRLLELLAYASGPSERAGQTVQILHVAEPSICDAQSPPETAGAPTVLVSYRLNETLRGEEKANPYVQPGDIITVPEAEQVYVVGNVRNPGALTLKAQQLTLSRAVMMAGGLLPDTKAERVHIIRQPPGTTTPTDLYADLKAIEKKQIADITLQANDIVELPRATGAGPALKTIMRGMVPVLTQSLPMRIIY